MMTKSLLSGLPLSSGSSTQAAFAVLASDALLAVLCTDRTVRSSIGLLLDWSNRSDFLPNGLSICLLSGIAPVGVYVLSTLLCHRSVSIASLAAILISNIRASRASSSVAPGRARKSRVSINWWILSRMSSWVAILSSRAREERLTDGDPPELNDRCSSVDVCREERPGVSITRGVLNVRCRAEQCPHAGHAPASCSASSKCRCLEGVSSCSKPPLPLDLSHAACSSGPGLSIASPTSASTALACAVGMGRRLGVTGETDKMPLGSCWLQEPAGTIRCSTGFTLRCGPFSLSKKKTLVSRERCI